MKIEICEQAISSWLTHIKNCQIVQTNWRPSPLKKITSEELNSVNDFVEEIKKFAEENNLDIFKQSSVQQMILQCEIDVAGVRIEEGMIGNLYLIDSAFHENGLNYGDVIARVLKKIVRAVFVSGIVFKDIPAEIIFVSPKCGHELSEKLHINLINLKQIIEKFYPDSKITLLFNEDFTAEIYTPLIENIDAINDDNDLFLRSLKLANLAKNFQKKTFSFVDTPAKPKSIMTINGNSYAYADLTDSKRGAKTPKGQNKDIVFGILHSLTDKGFMTEQRLRDLCDPRFSQTFSLPSFPVLLPSIKLPDSGYEECRFYKNDPITINQTEYLVCSQWIPERIRRLKEWYEQLTQN